MNPKPIKVSKPDAIKSLPRKHYIHVYVEFPGEDVKVIELPKEQVINTISGAEEIFQSDKEYTKMRHGLGLKLLDGTTYYVESIIGQVESLVIE